MIIIKWLDELQPQSLDNTNTNTTKNLISYPIFLSNILKKQRKSVKMITILIILGLETGLGDFSVPKQELFGSGAKITLTNKQDRAFVQITKTPNTGMTLNLRPRTEKPCRQAWLLCKIMLRDFYFGAACL